MLHILTHDYIRACIHGDSHYKSEAHLSYNLEFTLHTLLVVTLHFQIIVKEADGSEPEYRYEHQLHVDALQIAQQQAWYKDGQDYDDTTHRRGAFLGHLPLESKVAHYLSHLHVLQAVNNLTPEHKGYEQSQQQSGTRTERDIVHQACAGESESLKIVK